MVWFEELPEDLTFDSGDGNKIAMRDHPFIKESPELGHFVNKAFVQHREFGARLPVKKAESPEAAAEWRKTHLPKLYEAGLLEKPPGTPEEYEIKKPDVVVKGMSWSDENAKAFANILHKHGIPKSAAPELLALHQAALEGTSRTLETNKEAAMTALKAEFGDNLDNLLAAAKRITPEIFKTPEEKAFFNELGIGDHPLFLAPILRLAKLSGSDNSILPGLNRSTAGGEMTGAQVTAEVADIMSNPNNARHKLYWARDPATLEYVESLYKKAYGDGKVVIS